MRGAYTKFLWFFPVSIQHNSKEDPTRELRYAVGQNRLAFLKANAESFGYEARESGEQIVAFLIRLDPNDMDPAMPAETRFEYIAGSVTGSSITLFAYIWFNTLNEAKEYAEKHNMRLEGGWNE